MDREIEDVGVDIVVRKDTPMHAYLHSLEYGLTGKLALEQCRANTKNVPFYLREKAISAVESFAREICSSDYGFKEIRTLTTGSETTTFRLCSSHLTKIINGYGPATAPSDGQILKIGIVGRINGGKHVVSAYDYLNGQWRWALPLKP
jgi:hypothetical protein